MMEPRLNHLTKLLILAGLLLGGIAQAAPARVLIIRHAEEPNNSHSNDLSHYGYQRASALVRLFSIHPEYVNQGLPVAYFASDPRGHTHSNRSYETIQPLAQSYGLHVRTPYDANDADKLARLILESPQYDGKTVMIAWVHHEIPLLASALGVENPPDWQDGIFDRVWEINFENGRVRLTDLPESVMLHDSP